MQDWMGSQREQNTQRILNYDTGTNNRKMMSADFSLPSNYDKIKEDYLYGSDPLELPNRSDYKAQHSGEKGWRRNFRKLRDSTQEQRYQQHLDKRPRI